ncbi:hypothetical protein QCA50_016362 [Cerrena zonata]|uniref:Uncharacterized protein n=1 Tax=Cerrena zonata TaxID=2478898 RepID=A0AAW0FG74_9APHY
MQFNTTSCQPPTYPSQTSNFLYSNISQDNMTEYHVDSSRSSIPFIKRVTVSRVLNSNIPPPKFQPEPWVGRDHERISYYFPRGPPPLNRVRPIWDNTIFQILKNHSLWPSELCSLFDVDPESAPAEDNTIYPEPPREVPRPQIAWKGIEFFGALHFGIDLTNVASICSFFAFVLLLFGSILHAMIYHHPMRGIAMRVYILYIVLC